MLSPLERTGPRRGHADNLIDMNYLRSLGLEGRLSEWQKRCSQDRLEIEPTLAATV
jgi:hypothetical protein